MNREDWGLAVFTLIVLGIVAYVFVGLANVVSEILAALIGLGGVIVGAVIRYTSEIEKTRKEQIHKVQQQNYQHLLEKIGQYAQNKENGRLPLTVAHIESWVFAERSVVEKTNTFLQKPNQDNLAALLKEMRKTMKMPELEEKNINVKALFPKTEEGFE